MGIDDRDIYEGPVLERQERSLLRRRLQTRLKCKAAESGTLKRPDRRPENRPGTNNKARAKERGPATPCRGRASWVGKDTSFDQYDQIADAYARKPNHTRGQQREAEQAPE